MRERRLRRRPKWTQIYEKRYENSVLELKDIDTFLSLPEVYVIRSLSIAAMQARCFAPAAICALLDRLRNVRLTLCDVWDDIKDFSNRRHRVRAGKGL
jgi:hypothetical protein